MAKDKTVNPATAALKSAKQREIKKSKAATAASRTEKLARRNPDRLQKQADDLRAQRDAQGGKLRPKDQQTLEQLERDVRLVRKARETQSNGSKGGFDSREGASREKKDGAYNDGKGHLGKRRWGERDAHARNEPESEETETDEDVRDIPMPRDTSPPIPPRHMQRKLRKGLVTEEEAFRGHDRHSGEKSRQKPKPAVEAKKVYSSAPQTRDLQKEATGKFVPAAVAARKRADQSNAEARAGKSDRLLEPEELDAMEREDVTRQIARQRLTDEVGRDTKGVDDMDEEEQRLMAELGEAAKDDSERVVEQANKEAQYNLMAEEARQHDANDTEVAEKNLRYVEIEEVEDEEKGSKPQEQDDDEFW